MPIRESWNIINVKDSVVNLPILTINNQDFYPILDSVIELNNKCIHVAMGEQTWFEIQGNNQNDSLEFYIQANQYSTYYRICKDIFGVFYYRKFLFIVSKGCTRGFLNSVFSKPKDTIDVVTYYPQAIIYMFQNCRKCYSYLQSSFISGKYINNKFFITESESTCEEYYPVYHKIKRGETLEKIAKIYLVKPEQIMKLNNRTDTVFSKKGVIQIQ
jgi:hypothetical protein